MPTGPDELRASLRALFDSSLANSGYTLSEVHFADAIELTLQKGEASFIVWLRPASMATRAFKATSRFKLGHTGDPPDKGGFTAIGALHDRLRSWEKEIPESDIATLFERSVATAPPTRPGPGSMDPTIRGYLEGATFTLAQEAWLPERESLLKERLSQLTLGARNILLLNGTKGVQFYPSVVDFFATLRQTQPGLRVTCTGYFPEIFELQAGVEASGLPRIPIEQAEKWSDDTLRDFDAVLAIGPSDLMLRMMTIPGLKTRLIMLDLAFYHQLIDSLPGWVDGMSMARRDPALSDLSRQVNPVIGYSSQHTGKVTGDIQGVLSPAMISWRWFNYIPIGFRYSRHYRADRHTFDVALLGSVGRDYSQLDPDQLKGVRFLFLGVLANAPELEKLRSRLDLTVIPRVDQDTYARLLAVSSCVLFPFRPHVRNSLLSVCDAIASGTPQITARHAGLARLEKDGLPAVFFDPHTQDLSTKVRELVSDQEGRQRLSARSIAFAREKMDIYAVLERIVREQFVAS